MKIVHKHGLGAVDECEKNCLQKMQTELDRLGAYRGCWKADPDYPSRKYKGGADEQVGRLSVTLQQFGVRQAAWLLTR